jgi:iron complex outermembrane recepter protein
MNAINTKSFRRHRLSYVIALLASASASPFVSAQTQPETTIEELVVTGSRVQRADNATSPQPLSIIGAEDLSAVASVDIGEVLNQNPALLASVTSTNSLDGQAANIGRASNQGGSALNLRGMGTERTLTLVNGRRHVSGIEGTSSVDVSTIPSALIERVEVLTGGASAVYGADAVTGVVNFVLKSDFEGVDFDARTGISEEGDATTASIRVLVGRNFDDRRGNFTLGVQHDYSAGLRAGDRDILANNSRYQNDINPDRRFQQGDINPATMPNFARFYNNANTGRFPYGLLIPTTSTAFTNSFRTAFGDAPSLTDAELALINRAVSAPPRALLPGRTFNITSPYGVVALGNFPLANSPDLNGNGTPDCLESFTGFNSSLSGTQAFGAAGGCWVINEAGELTIPRDGLVAGNFNQFGAEYSYIAPNRPYVIPKDEKYAINLNGKYELTPNSELFLESKVRLS